MKIGPSLLILIFLTISLNSVKCEVFTAVSHMHHILRAEDVIIENFKTYISQQKQIIEYYEKRLKDYENTFEEAKKDIDSYFGNPVKAFLIIKGLTTEWDDLLNVIRFNSSRGFLETVEQAKIDVIFPSEEDLKGAAVALSRLQDTYKMSAKNVSHGILNGVQYNTELSTSDCYQIGRQLFFSSELPYAVMWLKEADQKYLNNPDSHPDISRVDILRFLSYSYYHQRNMTAAMDILNIALQIDPNHGALVGAKITYEEDMNKPVEQQELKEVKTKEPDVKDIDENGELILYPTMYTTAEKTRYEELCRKEKGLTPKQQAKLKCRYVTNKSPFLKIAPLKVEEASLDPLIVTYHDVLYDSEIDVIQMIAEPRFERAGIRFHKQATHTVSDTRISKTAWLTNEDHRLIRNIELRIEDMTSLTLDTSEKMQVVNYGIGGQYEPHFDFALRDDNITFSELGSGNRIATALFYMTDVEQGGATVFPYINVALWPRKGSAAVWFNLYKSGEGDFRTKHGACPVLVGSKWICNKWLHEYKQEFLRPCQLKPDHPPLTFYED